MLRVENLSSGYGKLSVLKDVSLTVNAHEIVVVLGNNGAGKSTLLRTISGLLRARGGRVSWDGERIDRLPPDEILRRGIAHVPEERRIFPDFTVAENLRMGGIYSANRGAVRQTMDALYEQFPLLAERRKQLGNTLSGGEQQILAICRGLMSRPKCLLLDEPSLGLSPLKVQEIFAAIRRVGEGGMTILIVEQNSFAALALARRGVVLETGEIVLAGSAAELSSNPHVQKAYLGLEEPDRK